MVYTFCWFSSRKNPVQDGKSPTERLANPKGYTYTELPFYSIVTKNELLWIIWNNLFKCQNFNSRPYFSVQFQVPINFLYNFSENLYFILRLSLIWLKLKWIISQSFTPFSRYLFIIKLHFSIIPNTPMQLIKTWTPHVQR